MKLQRQTDFFRQFHLTYHGQRYDVGRNTCGRASSLDCVLRGGLHSSPDPVLGHSLFVVE